MCKLFTFLSVIDGVPQNFGQYRQDQGMQTQSLTALFEHFCFKMRPFLKVKLQSFLWFLQIFLLWQNFCRKKKSKLLYLT